MKVSEPVFYQIYQNIFLKWGSQKIVREGTSQAGSRVKLRAADVRFQGVKLTATYRETSVEIEVTQRKTLDTQEIEQSESEIFVSLHSNMVHFVINFEEKMSQTKITIDNLPNEVYSQFAENEAVFEPKYIDDARFVPSQTEVNVASPSTSAFDEFSGLNQCGHPFSTFVPPEDYYTQSARFFWREIIPGIDTERLDQFLFDGIFGEEDAETPLSDLIKELHKLQRLLETINAHVRQFQKA